MNMIEGAGTFRANYMLGEIYFREGCYELAYQELVRSTKIYDVMDLEGAEMLYKLKARGL
ncbi:MAG: hypothetical protein FIA99_01605 [Ruminiclostridium sp.]|nr:hypothetical protein [Ruminiclostridium sp.]